MIVAQSMRRLWADCSFLLASIRARMTYWTETHTHSRDRWDDLWSHTQPTVILFNVIGCHRIGDDSMYDEIFSQLVYAHFNNSTNVRAHKRSASKIHPWWDAIYALELVVCALIGVSRCAINEYNQLIVYTYSVFFLVVALDSRWDLSGRSRDDSGRELNWNCVDWSILVLNLLARHTPIKRAYVRIGSCHIDDVRGPYIRAISHYTRLYASRSCHCSGFGQTCSWFFFLSISFLIINFKLVMMTDWMKMMTSNIFACIYYREWRAIQEP